MANTESPSLLVLSQDHRLLQDAEPQTDFMLVSDRLGLAYTLTDPVPIRSWSRDSLPGGQPDPPRGHKVWFKTGQLEISKFDDGDFWVSKNVMFNHYRNKAAMGDTEMMNTLARVLRVGTYISGGVFALSAIFAAMRAVTGGGI